MRGTPQICVVGQGPNRTAWEHGLADRMHTHHLHAKEMIAENYCRRVAITGSVGEKLANLAGLHRLDFYTKVGRENLNARWNGKSGKGDVFNRDEGERKAVELRAQYPKFVLLGAEVARCFGFSTVSEPLALKEAYDDAAHVKRFFLLFPHPSGINRWWNEDFNVFRARKMLREFLELPQKL